MFDIKKRSSKSATATLDGQTITFEYVPKSYTPALLSKLAIVQAEQEKAVPDTSLMATATVDIVLATVVSWDVTDGGTAIPITREGLADVPFEVLNAVLAAANGEQSVNPTNSPT